MKEIYIDTNFLLIPAQFGVDIFDEISRICDFKYSLFVLQESIDELNKIVSEQKGRDKAAAKLALRLIAQKAKEKSLNITTFSKGTGVDDILVSVAGIKTLIATQDADLKKRVKLKRGKLIILRSRTHLEII